MVSNRHGCTEVRQQGSRVQLAGVEFPLLSDPDGEVIAAYGAWGEKKMYGKKIQGILRTTVIIDRAGKVTRIFPGVKVKGHVDAVVDAVRELGAADERA